MQSKAARVRRNLITPTLITVSLALAVPSSAQGADFAGPDANRETTTTELSTSPPTDPSGAWMPFQVLDDRGDREGLEHQITGNGTVVASWQTHAEGCQALWATLRRPGVVAWRAPVRIADDVVAARLAAGARGHAIVAYDGCSTGLSYASVQEQRWGSPRVVPATADFESLDQALVNPQGDVLITYYREGDELGGALRPKGKQWQTLPPLQLAEHDVSIGIDVDVTGQVTLAVENADAAQQPLGVTIATLSGETWVTQRINPPPGEQFDDVDIDFDGQGSAALTAVTRPDEDDRSEILAYVRPRGAADLGPAEPLADGAGLVCCADGFGITRTGLIVATWSERLGGKDRPRIASRPPGTGLWTPPRPLGSPSARGYPITDVHVDGTVVTRLRVGPGEDDDVYLCTRTRQCASISLPAGIGDNATDALAAGPARSASFATAKEVCETECYLRIIRASSWGS